MSPEGRRPWWYSGDDAEPEPEAAAPEAAAPTMGERPPTGDEAPPAPSMDWTALVMGAAKMVDWATEKVMAPHAEHDDPAEHPDCMICRTVTLVGDPIGLMATDQARSRAVAGDDQARSRAVAGDDQARSRAVAEPIRWIPIIDSGD
jgi:hypothetical protein